MSNRPKKKRKKRANSSDLKSHKRKGKRLTPPLLSTLRNSGSEPKLLDWETKVLPEMLWLAVVYQRANEDISVAASRLYPALDILDGLLPQEPKALDNPTHALDFVDGTVSSFGKVPEDLRPDARRQLAALPLYEETFPVQFRIAIRHYPNCPMFWLFENDKEMIDPEVGLPHLKGLLIKHYDSKSLVSTQLRFFVVARAMKNRRLAIDPSADAFNLATQYPDGLTADERAQVEAVMRATFGCLVPEDETTWVKYFWRQNFQISACDIPSHQLEFTTEQWQDLIFAYLHEIEPHISTIRECLEKLLLKVNCDLFEPSKDEVFMGFLARAFRLFNHFLFSHTMWSDDMSSHYLRAAVDTLVHFKWITENGDTETIQKFRSYAIGKKKLLKLHLEDLSDAGHLKGHEAEIEQLRNLVNLDCWEEFVEIDIGGSFSGKSIRDLATEAELKKEYDTIYQAASANVHGDWTSLALFNMRHCLNPLHRFHRMPSFGYMGRTYPLGAFRILCSLFQKTLAVFGESYPEVAVEISQTEKTVATLLEILERLNPYQNQASPPQNEG